MQYLRDIAFVFGHVQGLGVKAQVALALRQMIEGLGAGGRRQQILTGLDRTVGQQVDRLGVRVGHPVQRGTVGGGGFAQRRQGGGHLIFLWVRNDKCVNVCVCVCVSIPKRTRQGKRQQGDMTLSQQAWTHSSKRPVPREN